MGQFTPEPGSIYRDLFDKACRAFSISGLEGSCYGDLAGRDVNCHWKSDDVDVTNLTPQTYGHRDWPFGTELNSWLRGERLWSRTTGALRVIRCVAAQEAELKWLNVPALVEAFALPSSAVPALERSIAAFKEGNDWYVAERRRDGDFYWLPSSMNHERAARRLVLHETALSRLAIGIASGNLGLRGFEAPRGYPPTIRLSLDGRRIEVFCYEFELAGRSSFDFMLKR